MVDAAGRWSTQASAELYNLDGWGSPYFSIDDAGRVVVHPDGPDGPRAALTEILERAASEGLAAPLLLRFDGILRARARMIREAFERASEEYGFGGRYRPVYPIKVNQQRRVVRALLESGGEQGIGLEVGSKPELLAAGALLERPSLVICNGYKDETYIELACLARRMGHEVVVVIEKASEIGTFARVVAREGERATPHLGMRCRLASRGSGRWEGSTGDRAKFGLSARQLVEAVDWLRGEDLLRHLRLLHFHIGSQITAIRPWKSALKEASRMYVELRRLGCPLDLFDVGGGLAVDYDGSRTRFDSSMNYSEQEYANDVVWHIHDACEKAGEPAPDIVSESGRALVAHHSVMCVDVIGASRLRDDEPQEDREGDHELVVALLDCTRRLTRKNVQEVYHDALEFRDDMLQSFNLGLVDLATRARCEEVFYALLSRIERLLVGLDYVPDEFKRLESALADIYFCNFSVFQSVPDHWAIRQLFPVMPVERLGERPTVRAVLGDITCDSDGKIDRFVDLRDVKDVLDVHPLREDERYYLGIFLVGAYQEILGDLHNLFGDTDAVHVDFGEDGDPVLVRAMRGEPVSEVLEYVDYDETWLLARYDRALERLVEDSQIEPSEAIEVRAHLVQGLRGTTYLTPRSVRAVRADDLAEITDDEDEGPASSPDGGTPRVHAAE